jgi:DnaJ-class molecular chaperone
MNHPDLYAILGVTPRATAEEIKHAYRALLRRHHPDTRSAGDAGQQADSDDALSSAIAAYAVLGRAQRRAAYDRQIGAAPSPPDPRRRSADAPPIMAGPVMWRPPRSRTR